MATGGRTHYTALGLAPSATEDQIAGAHDLRSTAAADRAWAVLSDPVRRAAYDAGLHTAPRRRFADSVPSMIGALVLMSILDFAITWHATHTGVSFASSPTPAGGGGMFGTLIAPIQQAGQTVGHVASAVWPWLVGAVAWVVGVPISALAVIGWRRGMAWAEPPRPVRLSLAGALGVVVVLPLWFGPAALLVGLALLVAFGWFAAMREHLPGLRATSREVLVVHGRPDELLTSIAAMLVGLLVLPLAVVPWLLPSALAVSVVVLVAPFRYTLRGTVVAAAAGNFVLMVIGLVLPPARDLVLVLAGTTYLTALALWASALPSLVAVHRTTAPTQEAPPHD